LLLQAWARLSPAGFNLILIGDGLERVELEREYTQVPGIEWRGAQSRQKVLETLAASQWLVLPSLCYENGPMVIPEAFSVGTPVIAPNHGAFPTLVTHSKDGLLFFPGDASSLADTLRLALSSSDESWLRWSENGRAAYFRTFTEACNYEQLSVVYEKASQVCHGPVRSASPTRASTFSSPIAEDRLRDS
jgi:glycosyltransferase involved in cell wall biosynthesis